MKTKFLISIFLVSFALFSNAQPIEIKGLVTFKTIHIKKGVADTVTTKGARALISLFNKSESKLVSISEDNGEYFFDLDFSNTPYTHIQFLNMEGGLITFPLSEIKMPFFDVVITHTEGVENEIVSEKDKNIAPSTLNAPPIVEKPSLTPETKIETTPPAIIETDKKPENATTTPSEAAPKASPKEEVTTPNPTPGNLLIDEPEEDEVDPETEKLNKELKELEEELKRLEKEKEKQTIEEPN